MLQSFNVYFFFVSMKISFTGNELKIDKSDFLFLKIRFETLKQHSNTYK